MSEWVKTESKASKPAVKASMMNKGESLTGFFQKRAVFSGDLGEMVYLQFITCKKEKNKWVAAEEKFSIRTTKILDELTSNLKEGQLARITCSGKRKSNKSGKSYNTFTLETQEVYSLATQELNAVEEDSDHHLDWED